MSPNEFEGEREMLIREFIAAANANEHERARRLIRRMNAVEYLDALERIRKDKGSLPPWLRR